MPKQQLILQTATGLPQSRIAATIFFSLAADCLLQEIPTIIGKQENLFH
jgi:hypothetical protein